MVGQSPHPVIKPSPGERGDRKELLPREGEELERWVTD